MLSEIIENAKNRPVNFLVSLGLFAITSPVLAAVACLVRTTMGGPVLFRQRRIGLGGREFEILKFRTMRPATAAEEVWERDNSSRVTPLGRILRATHLDETPQVLNILKGDMALVGPRPEMAGNAEEMRRTFPLYDLRHTVLPGVTGLAQVLHKYSVEREDVAMKLKFDIDYANRASPLLDLRILALTALLPLSAVRRGLSRSPSPTRGERRNWVIPERISEVSRLDVSWDGGSYSAIRRKPRSAMVPPISPAWQIVPSGGWPNAAVVAGSLTSPTQERAGASSAR